MRATAQGLTAGLMLALVAGAAMAQQPAAPAQGVGAYVTDLIEKACIPLIKKQDAKSVAQAAGLKRARDGLILQLPGVQKIVLNGPTDANPTVCSMTVSYDMDQTKPLVDTLSAWASSQTPPLPVLNANDTSTPGVTGWSWSLDDGHIQEGLVFNAQRTADGRPLGKGYEVGTVLFSRRDS